MVEKVTIYEVSGVEKGELYSRSKRWIAETYNSAGAVISYDDPSEGTLMGNCIGSIRNSGYDRAFAYNLSIYTKDERVKFVVGNFKPRNLNGIAGADARYEFYYAPIMANISELKASFEDAITNGYDSAW